MPLPVEDVRKASSAMLQKQLYAIFTTPTGGIEPILQGLEEPLRSRCSWSGRASCMPPGR